MTGKRQNITVQFFIKSGIDNEFSVRLNIKKKFEEEKRKFSLAKVS
jgi:hypothetical protein